MLKQIVSILGEGLIIIFTMYFLLFLICEVRKQKKVPKKKKKHANVSYVFAGVFTPAQPFSSGGQARTLCLASRFA